MRSFKLVLVYLQFIVFTNFAFFEMFGICFKSYYSFSLNRKARNLFSVSTQQIETLTCNVVRYVQVLVFHIGTPFFHA